VEEVQQGYGVGWDGLDAEQVEAAREKHGPNRIVHERKKSALRRFGEAFVSPFTAILVFLAGVSFMTDIVLAAPGERNFVTVSIIVTMVMISGILRFVQETRSNNAAERLNEMVETTISVQRKESADVTEIPLDELVVGDIVHLSAGDMVPADVRILKAKDLFINQAVLTGESIPLEKTPFESARAAGVNPLVPPTRANNGSNRANTPLYGPVGATGGLTPAAHARSCANPTECQNLAFMGSNVISGSATCLVITTGMDTLFGSTARSIVGTKEQTNFEKGISSVSWVLIRFMLVLVPVVFVLNGWTKGDWFSAFLFAISVAVGLTPEMLPMIVTTCLAKGAVAMSRKKTIIKKLNSIQDFGAMNVLCTDKTGTLTQDRIVLEYHLDVFGKEDLRVLHHAFLNSHYQTGLKNLMDIAILHYAQQEGVKVDELARQYEKMDEIPFDFHRRRMSVVVSDPDSGMDGGMEIITKGAVEEMVKICSNIEYDGKIEPLSDEIRRRIMQTVENLSDDGMRVIAVARKMHVQPHAFSVAEECDMNLLGYIAFLDPPKETTEAALKALREHGVAVKILTGDNERVTKCICKQVGMKLESDSILLGPDMERMSDTELTQAVEKTNVFAKLSPEQKAKVVHTLRANGHTVGFLGDGINDAPAMRAADVGISVDTAVDIAKESADVILLEKSLLVLVDGIIEGRKTYANMIKYIKMTASSNFGNVFSVVVASAFLPFLPMAPIHLILLNLIYDISCTAIPWDNVDEEFLKKPQQWNARSISGFMRWIGPTSSVFDITTYLLMFFVICPYVCGAHFWQITDTALQLKFIAVFQAGWFIESMWTQTLVIHMIRTPKIPFLQSRASLALTLLTTAGIVFVTFIPYSFLGEALKLAPLPAIYFAWLLLTVMCYMILVTIVKKLFIHRHGELL